MPGNLKSYKELIADLDSDSSRGRRRQLLLDFMQSTAKTGGTFFINGGVSPDDDFTLQPGWNRLDIGGRAVDTQGVMDGTTDAADPGCWFQVRPAGEGDYSFSTSLRLRVSLAGEYEYRVAYVEVDGTVKNTPFHDAVTLDAGEGGLLVIASGLRKDLLRGERLQAELRGPNGSVITPLFWTFGAYR
jgi:hypothetical protein